MILALVIMSHQQHCADSGLQFLDYVCVSPGFMLT